MVIRYWHIALILLVVVIIFFSIRASWNDEAGKDIKNVFNRFIHFG